MAHQNIDELHIEDIQKVRLAFPYFDLFHKRLKEDLNGNRRIFADDIREVSKHELSDVEFLMIFDKEESYLFVDNGSVWIPFAGELVKKVEKQLEECVSHDLA